MKGLIERRRLRGPVHSVPVADYREATRSGVPGGFGPSDTIERRPLRGSGCIRGPIACVDESHELTAPDRSILDRAGPLDWRACSKSRIPSTISDPSGDSKVSIACGPKANRNGEPLTVVFANLASLNGSGAETAFFETGLQPLDGEGRLVTCYLRT